jgi:hypothetical protein
VSVDVRPWRDSYLFAASKLLEQEAFDVDGAAEVITDTLVRAEVYPDDAKVLVLETALRRVAGVAAFVAKGHRIECRAMFVTPAARGAPRMNGPNGVELLCVAMMCRDVGRLPLVVMGEAVDTLGPELARCGFRSDGAGNLIHPNGCEVVS